MNLIVAAAAAVFIFAVSGAETAQAQDEDGCFQTSNHCVSMSAEWKGDRFVSRYTNNCGGRIYMRFCNFRDGRSDDCGASGVSVGRTKSWSTSSGANGRYQAEWVGSLQGSKDWVCSGKVSGWGDFGD